MKCADPRQLIVEQITQRAMDHLLKEKPTSTEIKPLRKRDKVVKHAKKIVKDAIKNLF